MCDTGWREPGAGGVADPAGLHASAIGRGDRLAELADELGFELTITDVDAAAAAGDSALRAEFGDRLPVVLLDGREHSYWEVDEPRLRADLASDSADRETEFRQRKCERSPLEVSFARPEQIW